MLQELPIADKYYYHHCISFIMLGVWIYVGIKGWKSNNQYVKNKLATLIIAVCLIQECIDFINRIFLDSNYIFSIQRDLPLLQFCQEYRSSFLYKKLSLMLFEFK